MADERFTALRYEVDGAVARLTIDREERRNALSWALVGELREALALAKADDDVRVVVLTGAGTVAFCAGADLEGMATGAGFTELHEGRGSWPTCSATSTPSASPPSPASRATRSPAGSASPWRATS